MTGCMTIMTRKSLDEKFPLTLYVQSMAWIPNKIYDQCYNNHKYKRNTKWHPTYFEFIKFRYFISFYGDQLDSIIEEYNNLCLKQNDFCCNFFHLECFKLWQHHGAKTWFWQFSHASQFSDFLKTSWEYLYVRQLSLQSIMHDNSSLLILYLIQMLH